MAEIVDFRSLLRRWRGFWDRLVLRGDLDVALEEALWVREGGGFAVFLLV